MSLYTNNLVDEGTTAQALESVIGKKIVSARVDGDVLSIAVDDGTKIEITDEGQSCCEKRHMSCDDDLASYVGATLLDFELADGPDVDDEGDVHETQFLRVHTTKDLFTVVNHNEHNGYYGGFSIVARLTGTARAGGEMMTTTTDETTHDHLLVRAEKAEAELAAVADAMHGPTMQPLAERVRGYVEACDRLGTEKAEALAACAEMRAALEAVMRANNAFHEQECNQDPCTCWVFEARAALSRTDLGRDVVVVPRVVMKQVRQIIKDDDCEDDVKVITDLDALLDDKDKS